MHPRWRPHGHSLWARLRGGALALLCSLGLSLGLGLAWAQDVQPVPTLNARVIDSTSTLSPADLTALEAQLAAIEQQRGAQLVVLIVATTQPEDIASYAQRVADTWKLGRRDVGDGLLIVVAKNDRKVRIEVAKTLEGPIPDLMAKRLIVEQLGPALRRGDYAGGLRATLTRLDQLIAGEALPAPTPQSRSQRPQTGFDPSSLGLLVLVGVPFVGGLLSSVLGRKLGAVATGAAVGGVAWWVTTSLLIAGGAGVLALLLVGLGIGGRGGGLGGFFPPGGGGGWGGGGGGGFSSGGGGDFGGGGASGDW